MLALLVSLALFSAGESYAFATGPNEAVTAAQNACHTGEAVPACAQRCGMVCQAVQPSVVSSFRPLGETLVTYRLVEPQRPSVVLVPEPPPPR